MVNILKERIRIQKDFIRLELWADINTGCRENWLNRNSHEKKSWIFNWVQAQYDSKVWAKKAKAFLSCIKRKAVSRKRNVMVLLVTSLLRQTMKYFDSWVWLLLWRTLKRSSMFRGERSGEWNSREELEMFSLEWRVGQCSGDGRRAVNSYFQTFEGIS